MCFETMLLTSSGASARSPAMKLCRLDAMLRDWQAAWEWPNETQTKHRPGFIIGPHAEPGPAVSPAEAVGTILRPLGDMELQG